MKMSSRERMLAALRRQETDHVPCSPYIGQGPWLKEPLFWFDQVTRAKRMLELGLDPVMDIWLPYPQPHPDVRIKTWREKKGTEMLLTKEYHTPAGVLRAVIRETDDWCNPMHSNWAPTTWGDEKRHAFSLELFDDWAVSRRVEPWLKGRDDLDKLRYLIRPPEGHVLDEWRMDAQRAMEHAKNLDILTRSRRTIVGDAGQWFCDINWFTMQLCEDPQFTRDFLGIFQEWSMKLIQLVLELGVDVVQYRGWYEVPTFWGPRLWKQYIGPCIEAQASLTHSAGRLFEYLITQGHGTYADVLRESSVDSLFGLDPKALGAGDLRMLFAELGQQKAFWGGVNETVTLESQDYSRIKQEVCEAIDILGCNHGLILSANVWYTTPIRGVMAMIDAWKEECHID